METKLLSPIRARSSVTCVSAHVSGRPLTWTETHVTSHRTPSHLMLGLVFVIPVCLAEIAGVACFSPRREISSFIITPILLFEDVKKVTARGLVREKPRWWSCLLCFTQTFKMIQSAYCESVQCDITFTPNIFCFFHHHERVYWSITTQNPSVTHWSALKQHLHLQDCFDISFMVSYSAARDGTRRETKPTRLTFKILTSNFTWLELRKNSSTITKQHKYSQITVLLRCFSFLAQRDLRTFSVVL